MSIIRQRALVWIGKRIFAAVVPVLFEKVKQQAKTQQPQQGKHIICGHCGNTKTQCSCKSAES